MRGPALRIVLPILAVAVIGALWLGIPALRGWTGEGDGPPVLYGNVDIRQVDLGFRVGGRIAEMAVEEGDTVRSGDLLARLEDRPYRDGVAAAEAEAAGRTATLSKLQAGARPEEIARARAVHAEQMARLKNAELEYERARQLQARGAIPQASLDQARAARDMAAAGVASTLEDLRLLEEGTRKEDVDFARAELRAAEARLARTRTDLADAELAAPADGIILSRVREAGAVVAPGETVYILSLTRPVWVRAYVPEPLLGRIHPGMEVDVVTDTAPDRPYRGRIGFISPVAEFTPKTVETPELRTDLVYRLRVIVGRPDEGLRQGMPVTVRLRAGSGGAAGAS